MGIGDNVRAAEHALKDLAGLSERTDDGHVPEPGDPDETIKVHSSISEGFNAGAAERGSAGGTGRTTIPCRRTARKAPESTMSLTTMPLHHPATKQQQMRVTSQVPRRVCPGPAACRSRTPKESGLTPQRRTTTRLFPWAAGEGTNHTKRCSARA